MNMSPKLVRLITPRIDRMVFNNAKPEALIELYSRFIIRFYVENYPVSTLFHHSIQTITQQRLSQTLTAIGLRNADHINLTKLINFLLVPFGPVESGQHGGCPIIAFLGVPIEKDICRIEPFRFHPAVQTLYIPSALLRVPGKGFVVGTHPFLLDQVRAPPLYRIGEVGGSIRGVAKHGVLRQILTGNLHDQKLTHLFHVVILRHSLGCRQIAMRPDICCRLYRPHGVKKLVAPATATIIGVDKHLSIVSGDSRKAYRLRGVAEHQVRVFQVRVIQAQYELLRQGRNTVDTPC